MKKTYPLKRIEYYTANSWNRMTAPAYNLKIHKIIADSDIRAKLYDMIGLDDFYYEINNLIESFAEENPGYSAGFNGRSGGYLVLYRGNTYQGFEAKEAPAEVLKNFRRLALDIVKQAIFNAENGKIEEVEEVHAKQVFSF